MNKTEVGIISLFSIFVLLSGIYLGFTVDRMFNPVVVTVCNPSTHQNQFPKLIYLNSTQINSGNFVITLPTFTNCELLAIGVLIDFSNHTIFNPNEVFIRANYTSILNQSTSQVVSSVDITTLTDTSAVVEIASRANTNILIYSRGTMPLNYIVITDILELSHG